MSKTSLNDAQRLSVIFEYFATNINNKIDNFSFQSKINRDIVINALKREGKRLSIMSRYNICINLKLRASIWSDRFKNEQNMLKNIYKYISDTM